MQMKTSAFATAALVCAAAAQATTYSYSGNTAGKPTYNRISKLTLLSADGTAVPYEALTFNDDLGAVGAAGFTFSLLANQTNVLVTTGFADTNFGAYSNAITGLGTVSPVPELPTSVLMLMSLAGVGLLLRHRGQANG
jgi:hypothetical protein